MPSGLSAHQTDRVAPGSRVWLRGEPYGWHSAEVTGWGGRNEYWVRVRGLPRDVKLRSDQFVARPRQSVADPIHAVAQGFCDSPEYYEARRPLLEELTQQRRSAHGLTAALSAAVELYDHQLDAVARVLSDPVLRFLLGDEVGLGKTIEAGLIVRQLLLDDTAASVIITVPGTLVEQWRGELWNKLLLGPMLEQGRLALVSHDQLKSVPNLRRQALVVADEAHRLLPFLDRSPGLREELLATPGLLLLSATPMRGDPTTFRDLLNLVDPVAFPREAVTAFRQRLTQREKEATDLEVLGARRASLRQRRSVIRDLLASHGDDPVVLRLGRQCQEEEDLSSPTWAALADYVRETYRISRRVVRHRRNTGPTEDYPVAGRHVTFIPLHDPARVVVDDFLERYRDIVVASGLKGSTSLYPNAVLNGLGGPRALLHHLERRLAIGPGGHAAIPESARVLLETTVARLRLAKTNARVEAAVRIVQENLSAGRKVVVIATSAAVAREFFELSVNYWPRNNVGAHLEHVDHQAREESVSRFIDSPGAHLLIGDSSVEEGRNLQVADVLVNLDLPLDPNRLEQRIGRLDRYVRRSQRAEVVVFSEPGSEWVTSHLRLLHEGVGIFEESVATLQRRLAEILREVVDELHSKGSEAFLFDVYDLRESLAAERVEIDLLDELESVSVAVNFDQGSAADLRAVDEDVSSLRVASFELNSLRGGINLKQRESDRGIVRFAVKPGERIAGLPDDVLPDVWPLLNGQWAFDRSVAVNHNRTAPFRLGDPLVDWLERYLRTDERGQARAVVRRCQGLEEPALWLSIDVLVEFDASHLRHESTAVRARLTRRGDALLPPKILRFWTNALGQVPTQPVNEVLVGRFDEARDRLLTGPAWREVLDAFPAWAELCRLSGESALDHARASSAVADAPVAAAGHAREEVSARVAILRARSQQLPSAAEREGANSELGREVNIGRALVTGIEQPAMYVVACGAVVLWPATW